jgi:hypothetical protein
LWLEKASWFGIGLRSVTKMLREMLFALLRLGGQPNLNFLDSD